MSKISVQVSLTSEGFLQVELPGAFDGTRPIPLRSTASIDPATTILRILQGLQAGQSALGLEGSPTRDQINHWERHATWPDSRCAFCRDAVRVAAMAKALQAVDEGLPAVHKSSAAHDRRYSPRSLGEVQVRTIPAGKTGAQVLAQKPKRTLISEKSIEELDL